LGIRSIRIIIEWMEIKIKGGGRSKKGEKKSGGVYGMRKEERNLKEG